MADLPVTSDAIQALLPTGFQIGSNPSVNSDSKIFAWTAFRDVPSDRWQIFGDARDVEPFALD